MKCVRSLNWSLARRSSLHVTIWSAWQSQFLTDGLFCNLCNLCVTFWSHKRRQTHVTSMAPPPLTLSTAIQWPQCGAPCTGSERACFSCVVSNMCVLGRKCWADIYTYWASINTEVMRRMSNQLFSSIVYLKHACTHYLISHKLPHVITYRRCGSVKDSGFSAISKRTR